MRFFAVWAAWYPHMPCTPPPGGVEAEQIRIRRVGGGVGVKAGHRSGEQLSPVVGPAGDRAAHVVRIATLEIGGSGHVAFQNAVTKSRSESFDLGFDRTSDVDVRTVWNVTVRVAGVLFGWRSRLVELALLHQQHKRAVAVFTAPGGPFGDGNLLEGSPNVYGGSLEATRVPPGNRTVEGVVDFE